MTDNILKGNHFIGTAIIYLKAAEAIKINENEPEDERYFIFLPICTLYCFGIECLLKGLNNLENADYKNPKIHNLKKLFNSLPSKTQEEIQCYYKKYGDDNLIETLTKSSDQFIESRYFFADVMEDGGKKTINIPNQKLKNISESLIIYIQKSHPKGT